MSEFLLPKDPKLERQDGDYIEIEKKLVALWQKILDKENISNHDNFFACGGTSLLAVKLATEISACFQVKLDVKSVFRFQPLALLSEHIATLPKIHTGDNRGEGS